MPYTYENLSPERFQKFCQALLATVYPKVQCFPVGQPDGGRDATAGNVGFQVKFARQGEDVQDIAAWLISAAKNELPKVRKLASEKRLSEYVIMTNVQGSGHHHKGSMDKVQEWLDSELPVPAMVWWRQELESRLDGQIGLKFSYPELLSGMDALQLLAEHFPMPDRQRRERTIHAYLQDQFVAERSVRFKQVNQDASSIFELFVDVPISLNLAGVRITRSIREAVNALETEAAYQNSSEPEYRGYGSTVSAGSAGVLLSEDFLREDKIVVIEGAPGQGKSTLSQFVCQIHRGRLLGQAEDIEHHWKHLLNYGLRLPIKIEFRDLAVWLSGRDPWSSGGAEAHNQPTSLEGAIASHISRYAGGAQFDVNDLHAILPTSPVLIILDALDEVANLDERRIVISAALDAANRMSAIGDVRIMATSRPSAAPKSPTFPADRSIFTVLGALSEHQAVEYAERWTKFRNLKPGHRQQILDVLNERLTQPHMAELARNTMQLTILLSLIQARGVSLPDARTALYDAYIDVFLDRESEKNPIVRDNRRLLIDLHRYIAYYLHSSAEQDGTNGRIAVGDLVILLKTYLLADGQPTDIVDDLFIGIERVFAMVSRVEGTLEFEVQPLREYFAARYLYDTAAYSIGGSKRSGTKPDRFEGIARNPYWANVTRFFAGCFSKGELADLADRTCAFIAEAEGSSPVFARSLAISMLQDWVFEESVAGARRVLTSITSGAGIRLLNSPVRPFRAQGTSLDHPYFSFAEPHASSILRGILLEEISSGEAHERNLEIAQMLGTYAAPLTYDEWAERATTKRGERLLEWIALGQVATAYRGVDIAAIVPALNSTPADCDGT